MSFKSLKKVRVIGLMSGTSLDGLDLCYVEFFQNDSGWSFSILATKGMSYSQQWRNRLKDAFYLNEDQLEQLGVDYGTFLGEATLNFMNENDIYDEVDLIASHGHTVFHEPEKGRTVQIGDGKRIASITNKPVVNDFRITDVKLGGQGAPLVPVGDAALFSDYDACLNLGGIANASFQLQGQRIAFDIAPCNLPLNKIMRDFYAREFDDDGKIASVGSLILPLLKQLNALPFYFMSAPKSLGVEWLNDQFYPILQPYLMQQNQLANVLHTIVVHEAQQIGNALNGKNIRSILITGGGAYNSFLISQIEIATNAKVILPTDEIIQFKEALIFAYLGLLNVRNEINTFKSVTGASSDSIGGFLTNP